MPTSDEKIEFSKRLALALKRSPEEMRGATDLALRFNLRYAGEPVSPQTAHKWLSARAIPTKDKLATLAKWLQVDEHWLHYGPSKQTSEPHAKPSSKASPEAIQLAIKIEALSPHRRYIVEELISQLVSGT